MQIADHSEFTGDSDRFKLCQDRLGMLKLRYLVSGFFKLILGVFPKLTPDIVNKSLKASEVPTEESFELRPNDRGGSLVTALEPSPFKIDMATKKHDGKGDTIHSCAG